MKKILNNEIKNLLRKDNLGDLTAAEKELVEKLFNHCEIDGDWIDFRYKVKPNCWVEIYGALYEDTVDETIPYILFDEDNYFRFFTEENSSVYDAESFFEELEKETLEDLIYKLENDRDFRDELKYTLFEALKHSYKGLGLYYDVYYDYEEQTFEICENNSSVIYPNWNAECLKTYQQFECDEDVDDEFFDELFDYDDKHFDIEVEIILHELKLNQQLLV